MEELVQAQAQPSQLKQTLAELEQLHVQEAAVLRRLERAALDDLTERKLLLWERLCAAAVQTPPTREERALFERLRQAALRNQILLHHARDAVRTILQSASGQALPGDSHHPQAIPGGLRVDFRG
jgi:flagellar biosynthesis/type III secretory pathway chaperone